MLSSRRTAHFDRRRTYATSVVGLVGHLLGTAVIFLAFILIGWGVGLVLHWLHGLHPFPVDIFAFILKFELYLVYADSLLCASMIVGGAYRFITEGMEAR